MSWTPADSRIKLSPAQEQKISGMNHEEIKSYLASLSVEQNLTRRDIYNPDVLIPTELATAAPKKFAKTVVIDGVKKIIESDSPEGLVQLELELLRTFGQNGGDTTREQVRDGNGRFAEQGKADEAQAAARERAEAEAAARAELELRFKRGEISAADYIEQSGAVASYLEANGVSMSALQSTSAAAYEKSWTQATSEFLERNPDWPGGQANMKIIGEIIQESGLADNPSAETLQRAFEHAKANNLLSENEDVALESKIASAKSHSEIAALLGRGATNSSGFFGR